MWRIHPQNGVTALFTASINSLSLASQLQLDVVKILLAAKPHVDAKNNVGVGVIELLVNTHCNRIDIIVTSPLWID